MQKYTKKCVFVLTQPNLKVHACGLFNIYRNMFKKKINYRNTSV